MSQTVPLFIVLGVTLIGLLFWAIRPPARLRLTTDQAFQVLSTERHFRYMPQILQALDAGDVEYLRAAGHKDILQRLRIERKKVALQFLDFLQEDYEALLEVSRAIAQVAPKLMPVQEFERLKLSIWFAVNCRYLRWRLRLGMNPWIRFGVLSEMAAGMSRRLEMATTEIAEKSLLGSEFSSAAQQGSDELE
jgi:hypothetical protein